MQPTPKSVPGPMPVFALEPLSNAVVGNWSKYDHVAAMEFKCSVLSQRKKIAYTFFIKLKLAKEKKIIQMPREREY